MRQNTIDSEGHEYRLTSGEQRKPRVVLPPIVAWTMATNPGLCPPKYPMPEVLNPENISPSDSEKILPHPDSIEGIARLAQNALATIMECAETAKSAAALASSASSGAQSSATAAAE